jgi:hypothetical protein
MRHILLYTAIFWMTAGALSAQSPAIFPTISGTLLDDKPVTVPASNGKFSVVAIAFNRSAEDDLKKWLNPLYDSFIIKEEGGGFDMADYHDVNFVFIPLISGFRKVADEFKKGTDKAYWPYIMDTEKTDVKNLRTALNIKDEKVPYFFVLDKSGKILQTVSGSFSQEKLSKLENAVD